MRKSLPLSPFAVLFSRLTIRAILSQKEESKTHQLFIDSLQTEDIDSPLPANFPFKVATSGP